MNILYYLISGVLAGIFSGLFGIGGGIILIPILMFLFKLPQATANGTSLVALLLPVGILAVWQYYKAGKIGPENIKAGLLIAVGLFIGAYFGARLAIFLPPQLLKKAFAVFLVAVAIRMWLLSR